MVRRTVRLLVVILSTAACGTVAGPQVGLAQTDKRVALVIGNSAYEHTRRLRNPKNDATAIAGLLGKNGFTVTPFFDLNFDAMRKALRAFADAVRDADIALVHFGGHGLEVGGKNYLMPTDAKIVHDGNLEYEVITLDSVINAVAGARRLGVVILDACRNNPLGEKMELRKGVKRAVNRGLARLDRFPHNVLVAYAAEAGSWAVDGSGQHSPFAEALLKHMGTPGLDVQLMFRKVRDDVLAATLNEQTPFTYASLGGDSVALVAGPSLTKAQEMELEFWKSVKDSKSPAVLRLYLDRYGKEGEFASIAQKLIEHHQRQEKAELAAQQEAERRAEEQRIAAAVKKAEEDRWAREAELAAGRRRAEEAKNAAQVKLMEEKQRAEWLARTEELRKLAGKMQQASEALAAAEKQRLAAVKAAEEATKAAEQAIAEKREAEKVGSPTKLAALPKLETPHGSSHPFDGTWTVTYRSTECRITYGTYDMTISGGVINKQGSSLTASGAVRWRGGRPGVTYNGALRGKQGSGTFTNTVAGCTGTWTAARK